MKIAFDVDVLAKQMSINDYVHKVADWGYKYIEQSPHPRINPFYAAAVQVPVVGSGIPTNNIIPSKDAAFIFFILFSIF